MASLPTLKPTGDSAVGSWTDNAGGTTNLWQKIEEGISGATDTTDYIKAPNDTDAADYKATLTDMPSDFAAMTTLSYDIRYALSGSPPASNKDTYGISLRIMSGATVLAAADSGGTFQSVVSTTTMSTTFANKGVTAFTYVNTTASKTAWDAAVLEIRQSYTQASTKDAHAVEISAVEFTGTYALFTPDTTAYRIFADGIESHALAVANDGALLHIPFNGPGSTGCYVSTPSVAANRITGRVGFKIIIQPRLLNPGAGNVWSGCGKWLAAAGGRAYKTNFLGSATTPEFAFYWSTDGTAENVMVALLSDFAAYISNDTPFCLWPDFQPDNGAGGHTMTWKVAPMTAGSDAIPADAAFTTVKTETLSGTTSIFDATTTTFNVGSWGVGSEVLNGKLYRVQLLSGSAGTTVAQDCRPNSDATAGATSWTSGTGEVWTCNGTVSYAALSTALTVNINKPFDFGLRVRIQNDGAAPGLTTDDFKVRSDVSGAMGDIASSGAGIITRDSPTLTDAAATTNKLGAGSGSYSSNGKVSEDGIADNIQLPASNYIELLYALRADPAHLTNGQVVTFDVQIDKGAGYVAMVNTVTPTITFNTQYVAPTVAAIPVYLNQYSQRRS